MHDLDDGIGRECQHGHGERDRAHAKDQRLQDGREQQQPGGEQLAAGAEPRELRVLPDLDPVDEDVDRRRHDEQEEELDEIDPKREPGDTA